MESPNDGKELTPEFFYLPEFLVNANGFDLGKLQTSDRRLGDVELPAWANNSPDEFIHLHRSALESDYVSANLHQWIDLIFGYKQTGQAAIDALNVYMYCSYEQVIDNDTIDDSITRDAIDGMVKNFGQNPAQLFTEPHPQRQTRRQVAHKMLVEGRPLNVIEHADRIRAFSVPITVAVETTPATVVFLWMSPNSVAHACQQTTPETLVTVDSCGLLGIHGQSFERTRVGASRTSLLV
jgi:hypothetical protein